MATRAEVDTALDGDGSGNVDKDDLRSIFKDGITDDFTDVASASTVDLGAVASRNVRVTGTTTITAFGTVAAGTEKTVRFAAALTLTHHSTSLILPGGVSIVTVAGDVLRAISLGSGNWVVVHYTPATQAQWRTLLGVGAAGDDVFVAATTADARDAIGTAAIPTNSAGVGNFAHLIGAADGDLTLPASGNWAWFALRINTSTGAVFAGSTVGGAGTSGGSNIAAGVSGSTWIGLAWRIV